MNIFVLDQDPILSAQMYCDKHVPKMVVELLQQLGSAVIRHGAEPEQMPLTKKGTYLRGGYHNHPCTRWVGDSRGNYVWACLHAQELCREYTRRFDNKTHFCEAGIHHLRSMVGMIPEGYLTPFALAMPDEYRPVGPLVAHIGDGDYITDVVYHATGADAVRAYRRYYHSKEFAQWNKGTDTPSWWMGVQ